MWQVNSQYINSVCTSWNKGVRRILNLPHDAHTWLLGPLLKQNHIKVSRPLYGVYPGSGTSNIRRKL